MHLLNDSYFDFAKKLVAELAMMVPELEMP